MSKFSHEQHFLSLNLLVEISKMYFKVGEPNQRAKQENISDTGYRGALQVLQMTVTAKP